METVPVSITYAAMKERAKKGVDVLSYNDFFMLSACSMFEYVKKGTDEPIEELRTQFIELYNICYGNGAIIDASEFKMTGTNNPEKGLLVVQAERVGTPNANGLGRDLICKTFDGRTVTIRDFETTGRDKVVYFKNNAYAFPDFTVGESGDLMAEIRKSTRHNIINSRLTPIVVVRDAKAKTMVEKSLEENKAGSYAVVVSDNILAEGQELVLNVTDVRDQDKIQYLNHAYDDELRHWYNLHGLDITGASKQAQQTKDEVSSGENSRKILPFAMLAERKKMCDRVNELYGLNMEVRFSEPWRLEFELEMTPVDAATQNAEVIEEPEEPNENEGEGESENENV